MQEEKTMVCFALPASLKTAAMQEAERRGISLSALIKNYLSNFLPENIEKSIKQLEN